MPYEAAYTLAQSSESTITLVDAHTGTDANITGAKIYLYKYDNTTIVPSDNPAGQTWIDWDIVNDSSITLNDILDKDYALNITLVVVSSSPDVDGIYTVNNAFCFNDYTESFLYELTQQMVAQPAIINSTNFMTNKYLLRTFSDDAFQAIAEASDVVNAQQCLNLAYNMTSHSNDLF